MESYISVPFGFMPTDTRAEIKIGGQQARREGGDQVYHDAKCNAICLFEVLHFVFMRRLRVMVHTFLVYVEAVTTVMLRELDH